jgi:hypothetical protein
LRIFIKASGGYPTGVGQLVNSMIWNENRLRILRWLVEDGGIAYNFFVGRQEDEEWLIC